MDGGAVPACMRKKAQPCSPRRSSGAATTATSATPSMVASSSSTSAALTFSPPRMMMSFSRSVMVRHPSASSTPTSPVRNQPSGVTAAAVSAGSVYPAKRSGPRVRISPGRPATVSSPSSSTVRTSTNARAGRRCAAVAPGRPRGATR